jgi:hypothetical protein
VTKPIKSHNFKDILPEQIAVFGLIVGFALYTAWDQM